MKRSVDITPAIEPERKRFWRSVFSQQSFARRTVSRFAAETENIPRKWDWPKGTYLQRRRAEILARQAGEEG